MRLFKEGFNNKGRTENVVRNINVALICQVINTVLGFVSRSFFISTLGKTYLGVNGIFSNILTVLSFAELGIGTAIVYNLYEPLKEHDRHKVGALINFYKKSYFIIGSIIIFVGFALTPFLTYLINEQPDVKEDISWLYMLYLISTVVSYYNAHKKSLLIADQKQHITSVYRQLMHTLQVLLQILFLYLTKEYIIYLVIQIACNVLENYLIGRETDRLYPFLKRTKHEKLEKGLLNSIKKDVGALAVYQFNSSIIHGTDNILITAMEKNGVQTVGLYANYTLISETVNMLLGIITNALTPSIGNLNVETDVKKKEDVFYTTLFLCTWVYGFACSGIMALSNRFVSVWIGSHYILEPAVVFAIVLQLYIRGVHYAAYSYRVTCGLFVQSKYIPVLTSLINIGLSIILGKEWGIFGILLASSIARIITTGISDPLLVYKHIFKKLPISYYVHYVGYTCLVIICYYATTIVTDRIYMQGWIGFVIVSVVFTLIFNGLFILFTFKTRAFKYIKRSALNYIQKLGAKAVKKNQEVI